MPKKPEDILDEAEKAIASFSNMVRIDLPTTLDIDDLVIYEGGTNVSLTVINDDSCGWRILIGVEILSQKLLNDPDTWKYEEKGVYTLDEVDKAIEEMLGLITIILFQQRKIGETNV
tara:strand:+ start:249 stop:599 length:351 start_codon:yes stop_codon:yes gene_type:complete